MADKAVTVVGLGRFGGGIGVTRWLCQQGARVTVSDKASADQLAESVAALKGLDLTLHLGGHREADFLGADLLVVNPAVPKDMPLLRAAVAVGIPCTTEINLFLERCPARVVGITGSVGKSTTTAMAGAILAKAFPTHVGGNIGKSLLDELPAIAPDHLVVLELSSFQLADLPTIGLSPHVAVVTNLWPNHLDRHGTLEAYAAAKKNVFRFQGPSGVLVLNADDPALAAWAAEAPGRVEFFRTAAVPPQDRFALMVPGEHNQADAQAAWAAAAAMGATREQAADALRQFAGLPHRLQFVAEKRGVRYYNDSKCTTPGGAVVALNAFEPRRTIIIVGGSDKGAPFDDLGAALAARAKAVIGIGDTREKILAATLACRRGDSPLIERADDLSAAVQIAEKLASPGDVVLLSPACASYDMFTNYEERGGIFVHLVADLRGDGAR